MPELLLLGSSIAVYLSFANVCIGLIVLGFILVKLAMEEQLLRASLPGYAEYTQARRR